MKQIRHLINFAKSGVIIGVLVMLVISSSGCIVNTPAEAPKATENQATPTKSSGLTISAHGISNTITDGENTYVPATKGDHFAWYEIHYTQVGDGSVTDALTKNATFKLYTKAGRIVQGGVFAQDDQYTEGTQLVNTVYFELHPNETPVRITYASSSVNV